MAAHGPTPLKTIVVLGASYGGARAAQLIAASLPDGWRVVVIDRNSHANHVYVLPRLAVLPGHEHKAFIPYTNIFALPPASTSPTKHVFLTAHVRSLTPRAVVLSRAFPEHGVGEDGVLEFEYAVYALGSHMPPPLDLWGSAASNADAEGKQGKPGRAQEAYGGSKSEGIAWLKERQATIAGAGSVLVVGGGALGIQFATDIAAVYPAKTVTLLHSRARLLPRFDAAMHTEILQALHALNVTVILSDRLDTTATAPKAGVARTISGRAIPADLVLMCTGQTPNTALLRALDARTVPTGVGTSGQARVLRTMQLGVVQADAASTASASVEAEAPTAPVDSGVEADGDTLAAALKQLGLPDAASSASPASSQTSSASPSSLPPSSLAYSPAPSSASPSPGPQTPADAGKEGHGELAAALKQLALLDAVPASSPSSSVATPSSSSAMSTPADAGKEGHDELDAVIKQLASLSDSSSSSSLSLSLSSSSAPSLAPLASSPSCSSFSQDDPASARSQQERGEQQQEAEAGMERERHDELDAALAQLASLDAASAASSPSSSSSSSSSSSQRDSSGDQSHDDSAGSRQDDSPDSDSQQETTPYPHIFVIGDAADAFGAVPAGHNAYWQAGVAARNVLALISRDSSSNGREGSSGEGDTEPELELERYTPGPPAIKVSLGLTTNAYQVDGAVGVGREVREDLNAGAMWGYFGCPVDAGDEEGMWA